MHVKLVLAEPAAAAGGGREVAPGHGRAPGIPRPPAPQAERAGCGEPPGKGAASRSRRDARRLPAGGDRGREKAPVTGGLTERCGRRSRGLRRCPVTALTQRNPGGQRCPAPLPHRPR